jgi:hypothetical protein
MSRCTVQLNDIDKHICLRVGVKRNQRVTAFFPRQLCFIIDVTIACGDTNICVGNGHSASIARRPSPLPAPAVACVRTADYKNLK